MELTSSSNNESNLLRDQDSSCMQLPLFPTLWIHNTKGTKVKPFGIVEPYCYGSQLPRIIWRGQETRVPRRKHVRYVGVIQLLLFNRTPFDLIGVWVDEDQRTIVINAYF